MSISSWRDFLARLLHRLALGYYHFRWRHWRRPWRYYKGRWYVVVDDDEIDNEKVDVLWWYCPQIDYDDGVCLPLPDEDYSDYVPMEDRITYSQYEALSEEYWAKRGGRPDTREIIEKQRREFLARMAKEEAARARESNPERHTPEDDEARSRRSPTG